MGAIDQTVADAKDKADKAAATLADAQTKAATAAAQSDDQQKAMAQARLAESAAAQPKSTVDVAKLLGLKEADAQPAATKVAPSAPYTDTPVNATQAAALGVKPSDAATVPTEDERLQALTASPDLNATQATQLGLSGGDVAVNPTEAERLATETTPAAPAWMQSVGPMVAKDGPPTIKEMIANILTHTGPEGEVGSMSNTMPVSGSPVSEADKGFDPRANYNKLEGVDWAKMLKGAGGKLGDFLQRWGMGLQGAPTGQTQGDIQRAQAFELQKAQEQAKIQAAQQAAQAQIQAQQSAMENKYQIQRMNLQNQMNVANIPIEAKADLAKQIAVLEAQYKNDVDLMNKQYGITMATRSLDPNADPGIHWGGR
jgi:hypothetical protein